MNFSKLLLITCLSFLSTRVFSQWSQQLQNDDTICAHSGLQDSHTMISDGNDGAILFWQDNRNSNFDIYAQRIDRHGYRKWDTAGVAVSTLSSDQEAPVAITDGNGGGTVAWVDYTDHHCYIQHTDSSGNMSWTSGGVQVPFYTDAIYHYNVSLCNGSAHSTIMALEYDQIYNWSHVEVNRIDANGNFLWGIGIKLDGTNENRAPQVVADGNGGAFVMWWGYTNNNQVLYAQRVDSNGTAQWSSPAVLSGTTLNNFPAFDATSDGNHGALIVWNSSAEDIYAQHINLNGDISMDSSGTAICNASGNQEAPRLARVGNNKFISTWSDARAGGWWYIYAQKFDTLGSSKWTSNGVLISNQNTYIPYPNVTSDQNKGAFISWIGSENFVSCIYAQHILSDSTLAWSSPKQIFADAHTPFYTHGLIATSDSGSIYSMETYQGATASDVYSKKVTADGNFGCDLAQPIVTFNGTFFNSPSALSYQWYQDGNIIDGATQQTYTPTENGVYSVEISSGYGCVQMSEPFDLIGLGIVSLSNSGFSVYPNLVHDFFTVRNSNQKPIESIAIYDETGRIVLNVGPNAISNETKIDASQLNSGIYFVTLHSGTEIFQSRIVKQ
jgi:hypothetical protein